MCLATHRLRPRDSRGHFRRLGICGHPRMPGALSPAPSIALLQVRGEHSGSGSLPYSAGETEPKLPRT